ncbi:MAG: hypothetical protein ACR2NO_03725 [Chloroflexota bacterium]
MRALVVTQPGSPEPAEVREVPEPTHTAHEALVSVQAISINRGELRHLAVGMDAL